MTTSRSVPSRNPVKSENRARKLWLTGASGAVLVVATGLCLLLTRLGDGLTQLSFDLHFLFRPVVRPQDVVLVYLDEEAHKILDQPFNAPWDRLLHATRLERLKAGRANAVVFDIVFSDPGLMLRRMSG